MDSSLDSIWDEPIAQDSPKRTDRGNNSDGDAPRPAKRARQALFLADSDEELDLSTSNRLTRKAPTLQDIDIDALFADLDDDEDDSMAFKPLPPTLDEAQIRRQAEARYRSNLPPLTPHEVLPSSSPQRDTGMHDSRPSKTNKGDNDKDETKQRRRVIKLDENRLLGPNGFPQLIKTTKDFRIKGKGHESADLNRLLQVYQYWTHQLYPKTQFRDTVERVEKLCHSRRMHVSLSVWRDEAHGRKTGKNPYDDVDEDDDAEHAPQGEPRMRPGFSPERNSSRASSLPVASSPGTTSGEANGVQNEARPPPLTANMDEGDEEAFWNSLDNMDGDPVSDVPPAPSSAANTSMDEDEDMWDIINELESETAVTSIPQPVPAHVPPATATEPHVNPADDWDDMYL
ncbi:replication fork protection component Swi3-domain-containing protein [Crassisporium funariophilum]|nr:replication fork protection component Swi3-domain-containing protein [Crassisporium funariophilum]